MTKPYNSVGILAFTVHHNSSDPQYTPANQVRAALMRRIADLDENGWDEAIAFDDTVENQEYPK